MTNNLTGVDNEIFQYIEESKSFLLLAGAGSGKTRSLINLLQEIKNQKKHSLQKLGQKVAVITYTNSACDEIKHRLKYDPLFEVTTIHSFAWELIKSFSHDIKEWKRNKLNTDIDKLNEKIANPRTRNLERYINDKATKERKLSELDSIKVFVYSASEQLTGKGSLTHSEVIKICSDFLQNHELMKKILVNQYPILFVDECQDTQKDLLISLINTQQEQSDNIVIGLFGDLMQRIYSDGLVGLKEELPDDWKQPVKEENYRCPNRVRELINNIGSKHIGLQQIKPDNFSLSDGTVRLFITDTGSNTTDTEQNIKNKMQAVCNDEKWQSDVQTLVLEHKMSARRGNFINFYEPLSSNNNIKDAVLKGTGKEISFLLEHVYPLVNHLQNDDDFQVMRLLEKHCPIMQNNKTLSIEIVNDVSSKTNQLKQFLDIDNQNIKNILEKINDLQLLELPEILRTCITVDLNQLDEDTDEKVLTWLNTIKAPFNELINYQNYINNKLNFSTHQSVKGLEYPRILAVLNDDEAGGNLFSYDKILGSRELSATDNQNLQQGKDNAFHRTLRLFYVICSRAKESLAVVIYTNNQTAVKELVINEGWFQEDEVIFLNY